METDDLDKILSKSYSELTAAEKETIQDLCASEEEFIHLQQVFASVENYAKETIENSLPRPETKSRLDDLFHETYQNKGVLWYNSLWASLYPADKRFDQRPLVRIAAVLVLFICAVPFLNKPAMEAPQLAVNKEEVSPRENAETVDSDQSSVAQPDLKPLGNAVTGNQIQPGVSQPAEEMDVSPMLAESASLKDAGYAFKKSESSDKYGYEGVPAGEKTTSTTFITSGAPVKQERFNYFSAESAEEVSNVSTARQNLAMLDLLTPTF